MTAIILNLEQIKDVLSSIDVISEIENCFVDYSNGNAIIPPVGELLFNEPPGDVHIKYGYLNHDDYYVVKIASSFYNNPTLNLPSSNGVMLLFSTKTGALLGILLDQGYLTDIRTAAAGAIVAKYFAPKKITKIGIIGTGTQAKLQLQYLTSVLDCNDVIVWGRNVDSLNRFKTNKFSIHITTDIDEITSTCNYIVTTTPSSNPLIFANQIKPGTHITAVGTDAAHKQELDPYIFQKADIVVADSIGQCIEMGDSAHAIKNNIIKKEKLIELGNVITGKCCQRISDNQITVADLTGVAVQDIQIAKAIYKHLIYIC